MSEAQEGTIDPATQPISLAADLFKGQTVVVSGGGSGIGRATAWVAARLGAAVVVCGRTEEKLVGVVEAMREQGLDADFEVVDIRDRNSARRAIDNVWNRFEHVDLLVNSAGGQFPKAAIDYSENGWNAVINTNLNGTWHMMQAAAQHWRDTRRPGSIVNIVVVGRGLFGVAHTRAARAGVIALSEAVSVEWGPYKIRVNCIGPGAVRTEGWAVYDEKTRNKYALTNPLMRVASAWEIAEAALFVGGPAGGFINGELLNVDGAGRHWGEIWTTGKPNYFAEATRVWDADALPD